MKTIIVYITFWIGLVFLAILNGAVREKGYSRFMTELSAHQLSTLIFVVLIGVYTYLITGFFKLQSSISALLVGVIWLSMTIIFEFTFGHYVIGHSWSRLLHDYNLLEGRFWIVVLIWTFLAPYTFYRLRFLIN